MAMNMEKSQGTNNCTHVKREPPMRSQEILYFKKPYKTHIWSLWINMGSAKVPKVSWQCQRSDVIIF